jgi:hypothetical protein
MLAIVTIKAFISSRSENLLLNVCSRNMFLKALLQAMKLEAEAPATSDDLQRTLNPLACFLLKDDEPHVRGLCENCRCGLYIAVLHSLRALAGRRGLFSFLQLLGRIRTEGRGMGCELILSGRFNVQLLR